MGKSQIVRNLSRGCRKLAMGASKHAPQLLAGASFVTGIGTVIFAVKGTITSVRQIDEYKKENNLEKVPFKDAVKLCAPNYIPAIGTGVATVGFKVGGLIATDNQTATLKKAYQIAEAGRIASETSLRELKEATKTVVGEEAVKQIEEKVAEDHEKQLPVEQKHEVIPWTKPNGKFRVYIPLIDSSPECIPYNRFASEGMLQKACTEMEHKLYSGQEQFISLADYMDYMGWDYPDIADRLLWDDTDRIELRDHTCMTEDGEILRVLDFDIEPSQILPM